MAVRRLAVLSAVLVAAGGGVALAADVVEPRAGQLLRGQIKFPRPQAMSLKTGVKDSSRLTVALGFDGTCEGGGLSRVFVSNVAAKPQMRVRDGRFEATLTGTSTTIGAGRTGQFEWEFKGRFTERDVVVATVSGTADVRAGGKVVSRCKTREAASVRLTR